MNIWHALGVVAVLTVGRAEAADVEPRQAVDRLLRFVHQRFDKQFPAANRDRRPGPGVFGLLSAGHEAGGPAAVGLGSIRLPHYESLGGLTDEELSKIVERVAEAAELALTVLYGDDATTAAQVREFVAKEGADANGLAKIVSRINRLMFVSTQGLETFARFRDYATSAKPEPAGGERVPAPKAGGDGE